MAKKSMLRVLIQRIILTLLLVCLLFLAVIGLLRVVDPPTSAFIVIDQWQHPEREVRHTWVDLDNISGGCR